LSNIFTIIAVYKSSNPNLKIKAMKVTVDKAKDMIIATNGKVFGVTFIKKDGSRREMSCRLGVKSHLAGGELKYDPFERGLIPVYDMNKGYRMVNLNTLQRISINGQTYNVSQS